VRVDRPRRPGQGWPQISSDVDPKPAIASLLVVAMQQGVDGRQGRKRCVNVCFLGANRQIRFALSYAPISFSNAFTKSPPIVFPSERATNRPLPRRTNSC
jgi:hypothetical protein